MSSHDSREATLQTPPGAGAALPTAPLKAQPVTTNYPPKAPFAAGALPMSHRPTSA